MKRIFQAFSYVVLIVIGGLMIGITYDGHVIVTCIKCGNFIPNLLGLVAVITGVIGIVGTLTAKTKAITNTREI